MLAKLDLLRAKILKLSLKPSFLRSLFLSRAQRILVLFLLALSFYLVASSLFPLWVLLLGPILWGVPHIISSLRYSSLSFEKSKRQKLLRFQFFIWALVFIYRLSVDIFHQQPLFWQQPLLLESFALLISFFYQLWLYRTFNFKFLISFLLFTAFILATWFYPLQTALVALIGHNYIPLYAWHQSCQTREDSQVFWAATSIYLLTSVAVFYGFLDPIYHWLSPVGHLGFLNWDYSDVINGFVVGEFDYTFWFHIVVLYAFSQSLHYFMWMKAIPENYQQQQHPPSFQWSYKKLSTDFGFSSFYFLLSICAVAFLSWFFLEFQTARLVYFSLASYHGFMEISALPFFKNNRVKVKRNE
jgi:hypothetical protein